MPLSNEQTIPPHIALEYLAMNIVHQIGDALYEALPPDVAHEHFVAARQATNDVAIDFAKKLITRYGLEQANAAVEKARSNDPNKCEFGHEVYSHKTADGWCCACEADIAFLEQKIKENKR